MTIQELVALGEVMTTTQASRIIGYNTSRMRSLAERGYLIGAEDNEHFINKSSSCKFYLNAKSVYDFSKTPKCRNHIREREITREQESFFRAANAQAGMDFERHMRAQEILREQREAVAAKERERQERDAKLELPRARFSEICRMYPNARIRLKANNGSMTPTLTDAQKLAYARREVENVTEMGGEYIITLWEAIS